MNPLRAIVCLAWLIVGCLALTIVSFMPRQRFKMSRIFGQYISPTMMRLLGINLVINDYDRLLAAQPCIIIANHQHLFDILLMSHLLPPNTITVGKKSIRWVPVFGWLFYRAGNLLVDRGASEQAKAVMANAERQIIERRVSVVVMPEGTRSLGKGLLPFKKGAFHLAIGTQLPIVPIAISPFHGALNFWKWNAGTIYVNVLPPIPTKGLTHADVESLLATARAAIVSGI